MNVTSLVLISRLFAVGIVLGGVGCAHPAVPPPRVVDSLASRPIVVLSTNGPRTESPPTDGSSWTVGEALATEARAQLRAKGFRVLGPDGAIEALVPRNAADASAIVRDARLNATAMYIHVRVWQLPYNTMRADSVIAALDVEFVDPGSARAIWEFHRPLKPIPLHGTVVSGQADSIAAELVMREVLAQIPASSSAYESYGSND